MNKVILSQPWGGLGDNLQYSTLPRLYTEKNIKFYISSKNTYRNNEIYDFVWGCNPYVSGIDNGDINAGSCRGDLPLKTTDNIISYNEITHDFYPQNRYPDIYYKPNFLQNYSEYTLVDLSAISLLKNGVNQFYNENNLYKKINEMMEENKNIFLIKFKNLNTITLKNTINNTLEVDSLKHYADILHSCKKYYCLYSGGNILSAGIKHHNSSKLQINSFIHGSVMEHRDKGFFVFDNVNYIEV